MSKRALVEGDPFFRITLRILSILLPVLAFVLYMVAALRPAVWILGALASVVLSIPAMFMGRSQGVRILMRTLFFVITALIVLITIGFVASVKMMMVQLGIPNADQILYINGAVHLSLTSGLLFLLPPIACSALYASSFDRIVLRVYAVAVWVLTVLMCINYDSEKGLLFLVQSRIPGIVLCVCATLLVVCSFGFYPPQNWPFKNLYEKRRERRARPARSRRDHTEGGGEPDQPEASQITEHSPERSGSTDLSSS